MEEVTEHDIFQNIFQKDQNSCMMSTIADCVMIVNKEYDSIITDQQDH